MPCGVCGVLVAFQVFLFGEDGSAALRKDAVDSAGITRVEELLRKHFRLLRDVYRHYSTMATGVTLEGLMKLYQDCKLRTRDLAPHHLEGVFCDHVDATSGDRSLTSNQFVLVLLRCAHLRFREKAPSGMSGVGGGGSR